MKGRDSRVNGPGRLSVSIAVMSLVTLVSACASTTSTTGSPPAGSTAPVQVEADMLSGGTNPVWALTAAETAALTHCLRRARLGDGAPAASNADLGFRAFRVTSLPTSLGYGAIVATTTSVTATTPQGDRPLTGCTQVYSLLRTSAKAHVTPTQLQGIPEG
jgi:hypothetical protein